MYGYIDGMSAYIPLTTYILFTQLKTLAKASPAIESAQGSLGKHTPSYTRVGVWPGCGQGTSRWMGLIYFMVRKFGRELNLVDWWLAKPTTNFFSKYQISPQHVQARDINQSMTSIDCKVSVNQCELDQTMALFKCFCTVVPMEVPPLTGTILFDTCVFINNIITSTRILYDHGNLGELEQTPYQQVQW